VVALVMMVVVHLLINFIYRRLHKEPIAPKEQSLA
jgi:hypothetical protein